MECVVRHRRSGGFAGEVPRHSASVADLAARRTRGMMRDCWTRDPSSVLRFRAGDKVAGIDTKGTPGFTGEKDDAPPIQNKRNEHYAKLQEMLFANSKSDEAERRSVLLVLQGMDTAGKGGIVKHVVGEG